MKFNLNLSDDLVKGLDFVRGEQTAVDYLQFVLTSAAQSWVKQASDSSIIIDGSKLSAEEKQKIAEGKVIEVEKERFEASVEAVDVDVKV